MDIAATAVASQPSAPSLPRCVVFGHCPRDQVPDFTQKLSRLHLNGTAASNLPSAPSNPTILRCFGIGAMREAAMAAFAAFTSTLETCRPQLDRIALGRGSTDCANAIPQSREGTSDLYRFAFWQFSHCERTAVLDRPCSSICRACRCYTRDKQGQDSKFCLPERMTTAIDDRLLTKSYHGSHRKSICRSARP